MWFSWLLLDPPHFVKNRSIQLYFLPVFLSVVGKQMLFDQPRLLFDQPGLLLDKPGLLFDQPGLLFDQPGLLFDQPGVLFDQPGVLFDQPGLLFDQPGLLFDQPGLLFDQPGVLVGRSGAPASSPALDGITPKASEDAGAPSKSQPALRGRAKQLIYGGPPGFAEFFLVREVSPRFASHLSRSRWRR
jgi:hypothetical protein